MFRGAWKTAKFKKYNFDAEGIPTRGGALHPLLKVREEFRNIFMEMGYAGFLMIVPTQRTHIAQQFRRDADLPVC